MAVVDLDGRRRAVGQRRGCRSGRAAGVSRAPRSPGAHGAHRPSRRRGRSRRLAGRQPADGTIPSFACTISAHRRLKDRAEAVGKANCPGGAAAGAAAPPGAARWDEPSTIGRPAGVSLSLDLTSPVVPEGSAGDAALPARCRLPGPFPRGALTLPRTSPRQRSGTVKTVARRASWGGRPAPRPVLTPCRPPGEPAGLRVRSVAFVPCTGSADTDLAEAWNRPVFRRSPPGGATRQLGSGPGQRCALRYVAHLVERITPGQGVLSNSQGSPQNFPVTHRKRPFIHRSCTALPTRHAAGEGARAPACRIGSTPQNDASAIRRGELTRRAVRR